MRRAAWALLALSLFAGNPANAYVRSRTNGCNAVSWQQSCVYVQPDAALTTDMAPADALRVIKTAIEGWSSRSGGSYLKLRYLDPAGNKEARFDRTPIIKFRHGESWARPADCGGGKSTAYDASAAAITTVFFVDKPMDPSQDGKILDADIELNSVHNYFYEATPGADPPPRKGGRMAVDLWNTLTHELGHLQGLEHTCRISENDGLPACTKDDKGEDLPTCSFVYARKDRDPVYKAISETTMFATAEPGETLKRLPKDDDIRAIVESYPAAKDPNNCAMPTYKDPCGGSSQGGCSLKSAAAASKFPEAPWGLALVPGISLALLLWRRRLRR